MTSSFRSVMRIVMIFSLAVVLRPACAALATTIVFPDFDQHQAAQDIPSTFEPLDPAAAAIRVHVSGDWTFYFEHNDNLPASSDTFTLYPELHIFFSGPHGNDGVTFLGLSQTETHAVVDFTGKVDYTMHVDQTLTWGPDYYANISGPPYGTAYAFVEESIGTATLSETLPLTNVEVKGLTVSLTAIPEPDVLPLLLGGLVPLFWARRRRQTAHHHA